MIIELPKTAPNLLEPFAKKDKETWMSAGKNG